LGDTDPLASAIEHARWFAAFSGPFDPTDALKASVHHDSASGSETAVEVASQLSFICDTHADAHGSRWLMRGSERRRDIANLQNEHRLHDAIAWRSQQAPFDSAAQDVVAARRGGVRRPCAGNHASNDRR